MEETGGSSTEGRATEKSWKVSMQLSQASACVLAVVLDQGLAEKDTGETKEKGRNANQVVMWIHANFSRQSC